MGGGIPPSKLTKSPTKQLSKPVPAKKTGTKDTSKTGMLEAGTGWDCTPAKWSDNTSKWSDNTSKWSDNTSTIPFLMEYSWFTTHPCDDTPGL
eukprot:685577-Pyramimonas_sp.AAC.1